MTELLKIGHTEYSWELPYEAGMEIDERLAEFLNDRAAGNLRQRLGHKEKMGFSQADFDNYMESYQLGVSTAGKNAFDKITAKAIDIAKILRRSELKAQGKKYDPKLVAQQAKQLVAANPEIRQLAEQRLLEEEHLAKTLALEVKKLKVA